MIANYFSKIASTIIKATPQKMSTQVMMVRLVDNVMLLV